MGKIITMDYINQSGRWPTGCESVSAVMVLNYLGVLVTVDEFIEKYIECVPFEQRFGQRFGANPYQCFAGSPYDSDAFGCYAPVIVKAMNKAFEAAGSKYYAVDETDTPVEELVDCYVNHGLPVVFWACIDMKPPIEGPSWRLLEDGSEFLWISNEHCMVLCGEDDEKYYFYDSWENHGLTGWEKPLVIRRHKAQMNMAVGIREQKCKK